VIVQTAFIATLIVKPDKVAEFEQLQKKLSVITHDDEPGTLVYDFIRHRDQPDTYVVYARFRDDAAFQAHQDSPSHDELVPPILAALAEDMDLQFYELVE
jgi:quinol monooxygenase YgiN